MKKLLVILLLIFFSLLASSQQFVQQDNTFVKSEQGQPATEKQPPIDGGASVQGGPANPGEQLPIDQYIVPFFIFALVAIIYIKKKKLQR